MGFEALAAMLKPVRARLQYGVKKELLPLRGLMSRAQATPALLRALFDGGLKSPKHLLRPGARDRLVRLLAGRRGCHYLRDMDSEEQGPRGLSRQQLRSRQNLGTATITKAEKDRSRSRQEAAISRRAQAASAADNELADRLIAAASEVDRQGRQEGRKAAWP